MKISEMITDRYKLRIPPIVYYDLLADVQEAEEKQEPFINKPCVSSGVCEHDKQKVLDKIRAEIKQYQSDYDVHGTEYDRTAWKAFNRCLQILDKYKAESEPQESEDKE